MWLSEQKKRRNETPVIGAVTVTGDETAVLTDGENRGVLLISPGGYQWNPEISDETLLIKSGDGAYAVGKTEIADGVLPGEVRIVSKGGAWIHLKNDGTVTLHGDIVIDGAVRYSEED